MASQSDLIKRLQHMQRLVEQACAERDLAYTEAAQWKQRYETEAHQRQVERSQSENYLQQSDAEPPMVDHPDAPEGEHDPVTVLRQECERLRLALKKEKEEHQKTRASLITALGDALQRK